MRTQIALVLIAFVAHDVASQGHRDSTALEKEIQAIYQHNSEKVEAFVLLDSLLEVAMGSGDSIAGALASHRLGNIADNAFEDRYEAFIRFSTAYHLRKRLKGFDQTETARSGYWAAQNARSAGLRDSAIQYFRDVAEQRPINQFVTAANRKLGNMYEEVANYHLARLYMNRATASRHTLPADELVILFQDEMALAVTIGSDEELNRVMLEYPSWLEQLQDSVQEGSLENYHVSGFYQNLAALSEVKNDFSSSLKFGELAMKYEEDTRYHASIYNNLANTRRKLGDLALAEEYLERALIIEKENDITSRLAGSYDNLGELYLASEDYERAIAFFDSAVLMLTPEYSKVNNRERQLGLQDVELKTYLGDRGRALGLAGFHLNNDSLLRLSLLSYKDSDRIIEKVRREQALDDAQYHWREDAREIYEQAVNVAIELDSLKLVLDFIEKSKALMLTEAMRKSQLGHLLADDVKVELRSLREKMSVIQKDLSYTSFRDPDRSEVEDLWRQQIKVSEEYEELVKEIERSYPEYYASVYGEIELPLTDIETWLDHDQTMLNYFIGTDSLVCLRIDNRGLQLKSICAREQLWPVLHLYDSLMYSYHGLGSMSSTEYEQHTNMFAENAYQLYQWLIGVWDDLPERLVLVPDGLLSTISFDGLISELPIENGRFGDLRYACQDYAFTYAPSGYSYWEMTNNCDPGSAFTGFQPDFSHSELPTLENSANALRDNAKEYHGQVLSGVEATRQALIDTDDTGIIDIETHAFLSEDESEFSFLLLNNSEGDLDSLFLKDVYNLDLTNAFVVIPNCNTNRGEYARGEGIISLGRAFTYAGASSLITGLWLVSDRVAGDVMREFYSQMSQGAPKDIALQKAKLAVLDNSKNDLQAHPYLWASLIQIGNVEPIKPRSASWPFLLPILILPIWLVIQFRRLQKNKSIPNAA